MAELKYIVRIAQTDVDGKKPIVYAMTKIKGVSFMCANAICKIAGVDETIKAGALTEEQTKKLDEIARNLSKSGLPVWMLNRRKDPETGEDNHLITSNLKFIKDNDIKMMKKIRSYRGVRHMSGLPTRGQKTRSNFRRNKGKVMGVKRAKSGKKSGK